MRKFFAPIEKKLVDKKNDAANKPKTLTILVTSNRGLCGAMNSQVLREIINEKTILEESFGSMGDKGAKSLQNSLKLRSLALFSSHPNSKYPLSFTEASAIAEKVKTLEFDQLRIVYNRFEGPLKMYIDTLRLPSLKYFTAEENAEYLTTFENADSGNLESLLEYYYASAFNFVYHQNAAVEVVSRRNAMDSASTNASEVGTKIRIEYNKTRQAEITTELSEIVSGAAAVSETQ